jgi:hypothetical protein
MKNQPCPANTFAENELNKEWADIFHALFDITLSPHFRSSKVFNSNKFPLEQHLQFFSIYFHAGFL